MAQRLRGPAIAVLWTIGLLYGPGSPPLFAQNEPPWLLLEQGKQAYANRDFGVALDLFRQSIAANGHTPEAEMWIGKVFEEEGETDLAVSEYQKALDMKRQFEVADDALTVEYSLARLDRNTNQFGPYEKTLRAIVAEDKNFSDPARERLRDAMLRILVDGGYDRLVGLYRFDDQRTLPAHSELGAFDYRTRQYRDALLNLCFSTITVFTALIHEAERHDPEFEYTNVDQLLGMENNDQRVADFVAGTNLFRDLYYNAATLYAQHEGARARNIWEMVVAYAPHTDPWRLASLNQLRHPFVEPLLDIGE